MCAACALPPAARAELRRLHMRGTSLREIAAVLGSQGHPVGRDTVHRHIRDHLAPVDQFEEAAGDSFAAALAVAVTSSLEGWPDLAGRVAVALDNLGAHDAALTVQAVVPERMRTALAGLAATSPERELLEARCLARACGRVLHRPGLGRVEFAQELAAELDAEGADDLAESVREVAARASNLVSGEGSGSLSDPTSRSGSGTGSRGAAPGPSAAQRAEESA
jgi:hypothetical protein